MAGRVDKIRVLHVDDEPDFLSITKLQVERMDSSLELYQSTSIRDTLERIKEGFDCIVIDYKIGAMDSLKVTQRIKEASQTPIILYTGRGTEEVAETALSTGVDDYIRKDYDPEHYRILISKIHRLVERSRARRQIAASERKYRNLLENIRDPVFINDVNELLYVNQVGAEALGFSHPEELIGQVFTEFFSPRFREFVQEESVSILGGDSLPGVYEVEMAGAMDQVLQFEANLSLIEYEGQRAVLTIMRDIAERKAYEDRLSALHSYSEAIMAAESFDEIVDRTMSAISETLGHKVLHFIRVGERYFEIERVVGIDYTGEVKQDLDIGVLGRVYTSRRTQLVNDIEKDPDFWHEFAGGTLNVMSEIAVPIIHDDKVAYILEILDEKPHSFSEYDVKLLEIVGNYIETGLSRLEVRAREEKYRKNLEALHESAIQLSKALNISVVTETALGFIRDNFGYAESGIQIIEADPSEGEPSLQFSGIVDQAIHLGETQIVRNAVGSQGLGGVGSSGFISEIGIPVMVENSVYAVISAASMDADAFQVEERQIMETLAEHLASALMRFEYYQFQQQLQEQIVEMDKMKELDDLKNRFIITATHELRTPIAAIQGYIEFLQDQDVKQSTQEILEIVIRNIKRLGKLTNDLLDIQRIETGRLSLQVDSHDMTQVVHDIVMELMPTFEEKSQTVVTDLSSEPVITEIDRTRINQVLVNLMSNASKYSDEETEIFVSMDVNDREITVRIRDQGQGIVDEDKPRLFKPFPGIRNVRQVTGTGLGLSICKGIIDLHGGRIWAESEGRNNGSTFVFTIPHNSAPPSGDAIDGVSS